MARYLATFASVLVPMTLVACGGKKPPVEEPEVEEPKPVAPKKETEEDRAAKRAAAAHALIPEGSSCLPELLKNDDGMQLEMAAVGAEAVVCAMDTDTTRLLGPIACWKVDLASGALEYKQPAPLPGRNITVKLDENCARGYCLPDGSKAPADGLAHIAWSPDGSKVAVLAGDDLHLFAADAKAHEKSFSIRGDKGVTNNPQAVHWVGDAVFVEGADEGPWSAVWGFKTDGTPIGGIEAIGSKDGKPVSTFGGSFSLLDSKSVAVAERGFSTVTIFEIDSGKRSKLVRKINKPACKPAEIDAYWNQGDGVGQKCKDAMSKEFGHLVGATAVKGNTNFLVMLRGNRIGQLAVLDAKTLAEKRAIKLAWCPAGEAAAAKDDAGADKAEAKASTSKKAEDPDAGGE